MRIKNSWILGLCVLVLFLVIPAVAYANTWDLGNDWLLRPDATRPIVRDAGGNDVWHFKYAPVAVDPASYDQMDEPITSFPLVDPTATGNWGWHRIGTDCTVVVNGSGADQWLNPWHPILWRAGEVVAHPSDASTVIEWRSPVAGLATASISLTDIDPNGAADGYEFWILHNDIVLDYAAVGEGATASRDIPVVSVDTGDSLYLVLGNGPAGGVNWTYDSTQVDFIVSVPDPPVTSTPASSPWSGLLAGMIALGLVAVSWKRRAHTVHGS